MLFLAKFSKDGRLEIVGETSKATFDRFKTFAQNTGTMFSVEVKNVEKPSSEAQHNLFYRIIHILVEKTGDDFESLKSTLLRECSPRQETGGTDLFGNAVTERKSLESLSTREFADFLERVVALANDMFELGLSITHSEEFGTRLNYTK